MCMAAWLLEAHAEGTEGTREEEAGLGTLSSRRWNSPAGQPPSSGNAFQGPRLESRVAVLASLADGAFPLHPPGAPLCARGSPVRGWLWGPLCPHVLF